VEFGFYPAKSLQLYASIEILENMYFCENMGAPGLKNLLLLQENFLRN